MTASDNSKTLEKPNGNLPDNDSRPPRKRSAIGLTFTAANLPTALSLQHCEDCGQVQYPPRELCGRCLGPLAWRDTEGSGVITSRLDLHHSLSDFFKHKLAQRSWAIANVKLSCGPTVISHLDLASFSAQQASEVAAGTEVQVFSHSDCSLQSVLIATAPGQDLDEAAVRSKRARELGLLDPAPKPGGF